MSDHDVTPPPPPVQPLAVPHHHTHEIVVDASPTAPPAILPGGRQVVRAEDLQRAKVTRPLPPEDDAA